MQYIKRTFASNIAGRLTTHSGTIVVPRSGEKRQGTHIRKDHHENDWVQAGRVLVGFGSCLHVSGQVHVAEIQDAEAPFLIKS